MTNLYRGTLLKKPPLPMTTSLSLELWPDGQPKYELRSSFMPRLGIKNYPECCAISILHGLADNRESSPNSAGYFTGNESKSKAIYSIDRAVSYWCNMVQSGPSYGCYLLLAISENMVHSGLRDIVEEYFGFSQLEDDFFNLKPFKTPGTYIAPRIKIMGLNSGEFCGDNI